MNNNVYNYLVRNKLIYEYQSGFLPKHSTIHQLLELYNSILNSLEKNSVITRISNSSAKCWTKFVVFLILRILILHKEMELSFELLSKLGGELDM
jgi:hypothetical protein